MMQQFAMDQSCHNDNHFAVPSTMTYSSASRILSRYRPIAPKPLMPKIDADSKSMSAVTFDVYNKTLEHNNNTQRKRRSRKRGLNKITPSQNSKRKLALNGSDGHNSCSVFFPLKIEEDYLSKSECTYDRAKYITGSKAVDPLVSSSREILPAVVCSGGGIGAGLCKSRADLDAEAVVAKCLCIPWSRVNGIESIPISVDSAFMQRAARMSTLLETSGGESSRRHNTEKTAAALPSSVSESCSLVCNLGSTTCSTYRHTNLQVPSVSSSGCAQSISSFYFAEGSDTSSGPAFIRKDIVTLSLLPDTPLRECRPPAKSLVSHHVDTVMEELDKSTSGQMIQLSLSSSSGRKQRDNEPKACFDLSLEERRDNNETEACFDLSFGERSDNYETKACFDLPLGERASQSAENISTRKLSLATVLEAGGLASFRQVWTRFIGSKGSSAPAIDCSYLERIYMSSSDPVLLTDEYYQILWSNSSFKALSERMSRKLLDRRAYIDDLGVPTGLACFTFLQSESPIGRCKAVLWGFLKKMVFPKSDFWEMEPREEAPSMMRNVDASETRPIAPRPVRPLGSTICLEHITEVNRVEPLLRTLDIAKEQIEKSSIPSLLSNALNSVTWINSAYIKMIGQSQQDAEIFERERSRPYSSRLVKNISLIFLKDQPPFDASSFSGLVRLNWPNLGGRSVAVPCHVKKIHDEENGNLLLWTFDVSSEEWLYK